MTDQDQDATSPSLDVVIVGAGFTGLAAARELDALGLSCVVLDAYTDHLGGRAYSFDAAAGDPALRFDHGAEYVGDLQGEIMAQIRELLPADALVNGAALRLPFPWEVMVLAKKRYCFRADDSLFGIPGVPPDLGVLNALGMIGLLAEMTLIEWGIDVLEPWKASAEQRALDQVDTWSWLQDKWWVSDAVRDLVRISIEALLSVEPSEISPYYLLWYTACNDGFLNEINDNEGGPQQYWLRGGTDQLAARYAAPIAAHIRQGTRARTIEHGDHGCTVTTESGEVLRARRVLVATSPRTAGRIEFSPPPPAARATLMDGTTMGRTVKCQVFYQTRWWHDSKGKAYDGYVGGADCPVLWVMDNSPPEAEANGGPFVLMTFTVGAQADELCKASTEETPTEEKIVAWVTGALATLFDDERAKPGNGAFVRLVHHDWMPSDRFVGGGPNTVLAPGMLTSEVGQALDAHWDDRVFFACAENAKRLRPRSKSSTYDLFAEENQPAYTSSVLDAAPAPPFFSKYSDMRKDLGYMSGAMESGMYVAHEIARSLGRDHALPARPAGGVAVGGAGLPVPTQPAPHAAVDVAEVLRALKARIESTSADAIRAWGREARSAGRGGFASWLRDALSEELRAHGLVAAPGDDSHVLRAVRDFAIAAIGHASADVAGAPADLPHLTSIAETTRTLDEHLATKFAS